MNADNLRASILQAAIEGKLVPQLESEPEVEQIGDVPKNIPFEIPNKWKWIKLDKFISVISGTSYKPSDVSSEGIRIIRGGNIDNFKVSFKPDDVFLPESFKEEIQVVKNTDIVIVASTGSLEVIGKPGIISDESSGQCQIGAFLRIVRPKQAEFARYLRIIFMSDFYRNQIRGLVKGTNIRNIKREYLTEMCIPVPPLAEQRRIVAQLNKLLPLINEFGDSQKALESLQKVFPEMLKASLLQAAIEGKLVPQLESEPEVEQVGEAPKEIPFEIPRKWKWTTIGDSLQYGSTEQVIGFDIPSKGWILDLEDIEKDSGVLLVKKRGSSSTSNKAMFKKGDVLYGKLRPYLNKCIVADEDGYSTTEIVAIRPKIGSYSFEPKYIKTVLMSPFFVNYANQASYGVKMPRLGTKDAKAATIPVPPLGEQQRIVTCLDELLFQVNRLKC